MPELNKANRQTCDVDIRILKTKAPFLFFDTANTTTAGLTGDSVYAMAKGARSIAFQNPIEGTMTIEAQVYPFKLFSLFSDGTIDNTATYADKQEVACASAGKVVLTAKDSMTIQAGTVFCYPADSFGDESKLIAGTYDSATKTFTATTASQLVLNNKYVVGYLVNRTGVKRVNFNNNKLPKDFYITMNTVDKDDEGMLTPFKMIAYKASINRNFDLSFTSEGDPATVTMEFSLQIDKDGNILDLVEIEDDAIV